MTASELIKSEPFELVFGHEFCERSIRLYGNYHYPEKMTFSLIHEDVDFISGRFEGSTRIEGGGEGTASGRFTIKLEIGGDPDDARGLLGDAGLSVKIDEPIE